MSDVLAVLASTASAALVAAAATDLWTTARDRFRRLLGRDSPERQDEIDDLLDRTEAEITRAEPAERPAVAERHAQRWSVRIEDHLYRHPETAPAIEELAAHLRKAQPPAITTGSIEQRRTKGPSVANTGVIQGNIRIDGRP